MTEKLSIESIYDNGGRTFDRYTVVFNDGDADYALYIGPTGNWPSGVCMHAGDEFVEGDHLGDEISLDDLPRPVIKAIINERQLHRAFVRGEL